MREVKNCAVCDRQFERPPTCGRPEWERSRKFCSPACKKASQVGQPSPRKGLRFPSKAQKVPCRICGEPTRWGGTLRSRLIGRVPCERAECIEASRLLKNGRIAKKHVEIHTLGLRRGNLQGWKIVSPISPQERALTPWFVSLGWQAQYHITTGLKAAKGVPNRFDLDFALPDKLLNVEIDGKTHRLQQRRERDARRDSLLTERGWRILRVPAHLVHGDDLSEVQTLVTAWLAAQETV